MFCPHDRTPLLPHKRDGIAAQSCLQCHGVWVARAALESLAGRSPQPASAVPPLSAPASGFVLRRLSCPACAGSPLQTRMQGDIEASRCRDCGGIWLAKAEVEKILATHKPQPRPKARAVGAAVGSNAGGDLDLAEGLGDATPVVAVEASGVVGSGLGDFLVAFLA